MNHLDLFSGIGGFSLAASWVWKEEHNIISFVEIDKFCQKVLNKLWPKVPIISDIKTFSAWAIDENDGACYNKICEINDNELRIFKISSEQSKLKKIKELIVSAKIAGNKCPYLQAWLKEVGDFVPENVVISKCEETVARTQMGVFGCEAIKTQTGKVDTDTNGDNDIKKQKLQDGGDVFSREINIPAKNAENEAG